MHNLLSRGVLDDCAVVLIGMESDGSLDRNARRMCEECVRAGLATYRVDYKDVESIPDLTSRPELLLMLFFPHSFWDRYCEIPEDTGLYGTSWLSFTRFRDFFLDVETRLTRALASRRVVYVVAPHKAFQDRDKIETVMRLGAAAVATPSRLDSRTVAEVLDRVEPNRGIFIKCRFGAEGKGITYVSQQGWWTNYRVEGGQLGNYGVHDGWPFTEITGRTDLLDQLVANEVIIEQEIVTPEVGPGTKFDLRVYVSAGVAPHMFLRINRRDALITNFSQGGQIDHKYAEVLSQRAISRVRQTASAAARTLDCPFVGIDVMFDRHGSLAVVEAQVFTDFPDYLYFNLPQFVARQIRAGEWRARRQGWRSSAENPARTAQPRTPGQSEQVSDQRIDA